MTKRWTSHGMSGTSTYSSWKSMIQRCTNPNHRRYADWGGRGVTVCDRWLDFRAFLADMSEKPEGLSLDRWPDKDGPYAPGNCRWATPLDQVRNRRNAVEVTMEGITANLKDWCRSLELNYQTVYMRISRGGLTPLEALILPLAQGGHTMWRKEQRN